MLDPQITGFSIRHAAHLARLSELAYQPLTDITLGTLASIGYTAKLVERDDTSVLVLTDEANIVFAFRGTEPTHLVDLCVDARLCREPGPGGSKIHGGFRQALRLVERDLLQVLKTEGHGKARWLTGHSLGGSLAILAAGLVSTVMGEAMHGVYTFAPARVGNGTWATLYDSVVPRSWWFARDLDGVVRLPPRAAGYRHVSGRRYLRGGRIIDGEGWWLLGLAQGFDPLRAFVPGTGALDDHAVRLYVRDLETLAAQEVASTP